MKECKCGQPSRVRKIGKAVKLALAKLGSGGSARLCPTLMQPIQKSLIALLWLLRRGCAPNFQGCVNQLLQMAQEIGRNGLDGHAFFACGRFGQALTDWHNAPTTRHRTSCLAISCSLRCLSNCQFLFLSHRISETGPGKRKFQKYLAQSLWHPKLIFVVEVLPA